MLGAVLLLGLFSLIAIGIVCLTVVTVVTAKLEKRKQGIETLAEAFNNVAEAITEALAK